MGLPVGCGFVGRKVGKSGGGEGRSVGSAEGRGDGSNVGNVEGRTVGSEVGRGEG